jgi:hypothetical protein
MGRTVRGVPQLSIPVQLPHWALFAAQRAASGSGTQAHVLGAVAPHWPPFAHNPQSTVRSVPQLSGDVSEPHWAPALRQSSASGSGLHPHTLGVTAPHWSPAGQLPQLTVRWVPQLSAAVSEPQVALAALHSWASVSG